MSIKDCPAEKPAAGRRLRYALDGLLTVEELATKLKVKPRTVRAWIEKRAIPFTRLGRRVYFYVGIVEDVLKRNAVVPSPGQTPAGQGGAEEEGDDNS